MDLEVASRKVKIERKTRETDISLTLDPDIAAEPAVRTGIPFFDHMLRSMSFHGRFSLSVEGRGDIDVDPHHLVEDVGLVLGQAFSAVFEKAGSVARFGHAVVPMDEALSEVTIDVCGRPTLSLHALLPSLSPARSTSHSFASSSRVFRPRRESVSISSCEEGRTAITWRNRRSRPSARR